MGFNKGVFWVIFHSIKVDIAANPWYPTPEEFRKIKEYIKQGSERFFQYPVTATLGETIKTYLSLARVYKTILNAEDCRCPVTALENKYPSLMQIPAGGRIKKFVGKTVQKPSNIRFCKLC